MLEDKTEANDWTRGYPLDLLRMLAYQFKVRHKPHVYGAFGLTKERDIADAMANGALRAVGGAGSQVQAVMIGKVLSRDSLHSDFAQTQFRIPAGALYVKALACSDWKWGANLVKEAMWERREAGIPRETWVEIFEEDEASREAVMMAGLEHAFSKVMAGGEIKGMYTNAKIYPEQRVGAAELLTLAVVRDGFLSMADLAEINEEIAAYANAVSGAWAQHYSSYNKRQSWTSFAIRGYDQADPSFIIAPREMSKAWKDSHPLRLVSIPSWTSAVAHFPKTREIVARIPGEKDRVRFMRLSAGGGELTRHADITDRMAGVADGKVARLHIPIVTNSGVRFTGWDCRGLEVPLHMPARALCYLDQRKPHRAVNEGPTDRIHLVVDVLSNPELRQWLAQAHQ